MIVYPVSKSQTGEHWALPVAFVLPFTQLIQVDLIGTLYLQDIIAPVLLIILLSMSGVGKQLRPLRTFLLLASTWLLGAIITDFYRDTPFNDLARGWSRIALFMIHTTTLWLLAGGRFHVLGGYLVGAGSASLFQVILLPSQFAEADPWKFGVGGGLVLVATGLSTFEGLRKALGRYSFSLLLLILAIISFFQDSRSLFAITLFAACYSGLAILISDRPHLYRRVTTASFTVSALAGLVLVQLLIQLYGFAAESGTLGLDARTKFLAQTGGDVSLLLAGRSQILVSLQAIWDSPIIGHGSWAQDPYYVWMYYGMLAERGLTDPLSYYIETFGYLIPTHSYLFGAWVEAGILGLPLWIWTLFIIIKALFVTLKQNLISSQLVVLPAFLLLWDIPFSPFGSSARVTVAAQICIILLATLALQNAAKSRQARNLGNLTGPSS